jgi:hypothetical protein
MIKWRHCTHQLGKTTVSWWKDGGCAVRLTWLKATQVWAEVAICPGLHQTEGFPRHVTFTQKSREWICEGWLCPPAVSIWVPNKLRARWTVAMFWTWNVPHRLMYWGLGCQLMGFGKVMGSWGLWLNLIHRWMHIRRWWKVGEGASWRKLVLGGL